MHDMPEISTEIFEAVPVVFSLGFGVSCLAVFLAGVLVGVFKALTKIIGR